VITLTASEWGLLRASVKQYKVRRLKGTDAKVWRQLVDRVLQKLEKESSKFDTPESTVEVELEPMEIESYAIDFSDLKLPSYD
jgi:hypothetical protein